MYNEQNIQFPRIIAVVFIVCITFVIGLFYFLTNYEYTGIGPDQEFVVDDASRPQQFVLPSRLMPVVIWYRIEGMADNSASVAFQKDMDAYGYVKFKGVVADNAVRDFTNQEISLSAMKLKESKRDI